MSGERRKPYVPAGVIKTLFPPPTPPWPESVPFLLPPTAWAECVSAVEDSRPEAYLIACDSKVQRVDHVEPGDPLPDKLNLPGGGGTSFVPVFDRIESDGLSPAVVVYFTDLEGRFPSADPGYPVLWVTDNDSRRAPFGLTLAVLS